MWTETSLLELRPLAATEWLDAQLLAVSTVSGWPTDTAESLQTYVQGQGNFLSGNSVFACTCTSYTGMCFTGSPTVMCVLAGRPREIFGKEGEVYRFSGLNVPSAPSV